MAEPCKCAFQRHLFPQCTQEKELRDLLRSNDPPSTFQASHCRSLSTASPAELAALLRARSDRAAVQDYSRLCDAVISPVRRLPAEILVEIFVYFTTALHWPCIEEEMRRVANVDLLRIAQVCPRWHELVMGTPSLWSCIEVDMRHWTAPGSRLLHLLKTVLDRGGGFPLDLGIVCGDGDLLASYSLRWRHVAFRVWTTKLAEYSKLSGIAGNLPVLRSLAIDPGWNDLGVMTIFEVFLRGFPDELPELPWEQLEYVGFEDVGPEEWAGVATTVARLSGRVSWEETATIPAVPAQSRTACCSFTLPFLESLRFYSQYAGVPLPFPTDDFLALAHRSSFSSHLTVLMLDPVLVTQAELLQMLEVLPSLDNLSISDHKQIPGAPTEFVLLSDSLLRHLTWTSGPACLVPTLSYLGCHTLLRFDDSVYRDFVLSRILPGRNERGPFEVELFWDSDNHRDLDSGVLAQFKELESCDELWFSLQPSPMFKAGRRK
ncbi:hypothetical protein FB45DRAFT_894573, partial [Roridomyces roridus]